MAAELPEIWIRGYIFSFSSSFSFLFFLSGNAYTQQRGGKGKKSSADDQPRGLVRYNSRVAAGIKSAKRDKEDIKSVALSVKSHLTGGCNSRGNFLPH